MNMNFQGPVTAGSMIVGGRDVNVGGDNVPILLRLATWLGEHGKAIIGMLPR